MDGDRDLGFLGPFWGKFGSIWVNLGGLKIASILLSTPLPFWVIFLHFWGHSVADFQAPLYRVGIGFEIWDFWGRFGANLDRFG